MITFPSMSIMTMRKISQTLLSERLMIKAEFKRKEIGLLKPRTLECILFIRNAALKIASPQKCFGTP